MGFEFPLQGSLTSTFPEHDQHVAFVRAHALGSGGLNLIEVCGQGLKVEHVLLRAGRVLIHNHSSQPWLDFSKRPLGTIQPLGWGRVEQELRLHASAGHVGF